MEEQRLLSQNLEYFQNELLPYYLVLHTSSGAIVINIQKENLKHLLGIPHSNFKLNNIRPIEFFEDLEQNKYDLFDLIDKDRFYENNLLYEEELIYRKNYYFTTVFNSLINSPKIYLYRKTYLNNQFDADYVHFQIDDGFGLYIGIVGDIDSGYYFFNSVLAESDNPRKYLTSSSKVKITKIERIKKDDFNPESFKFVRSKNYQNKCVPTAPKKKKNLDYKALKNTINKKLEPHLNISVGRYGKNSIQVYKDSNCIETNEHIPNELTDVNDIVNYLMEKYLK